MTASYRAHTQGAHSSSTTATLTKPTGTAEGDVMVAVLINNDYNRTITPPSGWTSVCDSGTSTSPSTRMWVYTRVAGASEPSSWNWTFDFTFNGRAGIVSYKDAGTVNVYAAASVGSIETGPYTAVAPTMTTTVDNVLKVIIAGVRVTTTGTAPAAAQPSGYTERVESAGAFDVCAWSAGDEVQSSAGATGAETVTWTASGAGNGRGHAVHIGIGPATSSYFGRPNADESAGSWTASSGSDLYAMIDEETASDADYITAGSATTCEVALTTLSEPPSGWQTTVRYRILGDCIVSLREGASTTIASWTHDPGPGSATTYEQTLTSGEQGTVSDWSDLRLRFEKPA